MLILYVPFSELLASQRMDRRCGKQRHCVDTVRANVCIASLTLDGASLC